LASRLGLLSLLLPCNTQEGRSPTICCLAIPADMSMADFCNFCGAYLEAIRSMRVLRREARSQVVCMVLIRFGSQQQADEFYQHFNQKPVREEREERRTLMQRVSTGPFADSLVHILDTSPMCAILVPLFFRNQGFCLSQIFAQVLLHSVLAFNRSTFTHKTHTHKQHDHAKSAFPHTSMQSRNKHSPTRKQWDLTVLQPGA